MISEIFIWVSYEAYQALIASVYQCENAMEQSSLVIAMNYEQQKQYEDLYKEIGMLQLRKLSS